MKNKILLIGLACFLLGIGCGYFIRPEQKAIAVSPPLKVKLSSQGRAEMKKMIEKINLLLNQSVGEIMAEKTRMLQAITAKEPDRAAADFYLSGAEQKISEIQAGINKELLDALEKMPLIDRRAYMEFYLENKPKTKIQGLIFPLTAATGFLGIDEEIVINPAFPTVDPL